MMRRKLAKQRIIHEDEMTAVKSACVNLFGLALAAFLSGGAFLLPFIIRHLS